MSKNIPVSDRVLRSHTREQKEKKVSNQAEQIIKGLKKSIKGNRISSVDLDNKIKEFRSCIGREKEKTTEMAGLRTVPIALSSVCGSSVTTPKHTQYNELISKMKTKHVKMLEEVEKEIEFVVNLCRELEIDLE